MSIFIQTERLLTDNPELKEVLDTYYQLDHVFRQFEGVMNPATETILISASTEGIEFDLPSPAILLDAPNNTNVKIEETPPYSPDTEGNTSAG